MFPRNSKNPVEQELNESREDYVKTIYALKKRMPIVRPVDVAHAMGFTRPSVSRATTMLREKGLITMDGKSGISLTEKGLEVAKRIYEKHELLKDFLMKTAGTDEETAEEEACRMEHFISPVTMAGIQRYVKDGEV